MTGTTLDFKKHSRIPFGAYVESHEDYNTTNTMAEITRGTMCFGPTENFQGSYKLLCLKTARRVTRKQLKDFTMPTSGIKRIAEIAEREKQGEDLVFTENGNTILDPNEEDDVVATAGVDTETDNEAGGNNDEHETDNEEYNNNNNQQFITDDDEQPGINMETEEIDAEGMIEGELEGGTAGAPQEGTLGETDGETAGVAPEDEPEGELHGETAGVLEGGGADDETAGVIGDGDPGILEDGETNGETAGVLGDEDPNNETTGVFGDKHAPSNEGGDITYNDNQPSANE
jgi:hypothetical protein